MTGPRFVELQKNVNQKTEISIRTNLFLKYCANLEQVNNFQRQRLNGSFIFMFADTFILFLSKIT